MINPIINNTDIDFIYKLFFCRLRYYVQRSLLVAIKMSLKVHCDNLLQEVSESLHQTSTINSLNSEITGYVSGIS